VVPIDGIWLYDGCYFGGDPVSVHVRNMRRDSRATLHLEDGEAAVIVDGTTEWVMPSKTVAQRLATATTAKYRYPQSASDHLEGVWRLRPAKVLAWNTLYINATRFLFD
jgi:hypothetical protein